jgi:hypothetical protein
VRPQGICASADFGTKNYNCEIDSDPESKLCIQKLELVENCGEIRDEESCKLFKKTVDQNGIVKFIFYFIFCYVYIFLFCLVVIVCSYRNNVCYEKGTKCDDFSERGDGGLLCGISCLFIFYFFFIMVLYSEWRMFL